MKATDEERAEFHRLLDVVLDDPDPTHTYSHTRLWSPDRITHISLNVHRTEEHFSAPFYPDL